MSQLKFSKTASTLLKIFLSLAALGYVFSKIELKQVLLITGNSNFLLLFAALVLFIISKIIAAFRLNLFFNATGIILTEIYNLKLYLLGMFYNLFLPGGIGGDGYKIYLLNKLYKVKAGKIFWAVLNDRLTGVFALSCLAMFLAGFINFTFPFLNKSLVWLGIPLTGILFFLFFALFFPYLKKVFFSVSLLSLIVQIVQLSCAFCILKATGEDQNTVEYLFLFLISSIVAMLPITIGGAGSREITFLFGSGILHLNGNTSITLSLVFYLITLFTSFWGIIFSVGTGRLEKIESMNTDKTGDKRSSGSKVPY